MCTASWLIHDDGFELFFNRDESLARGRARAPEAFLQAGVRVLAPIDPDGGGTWLGVNEHGLAIGLLNAALLNGASPAAPRSRGLLVRDLLAARNPDEALARLERESLAGYRGFALALFGRGEEPRIRTWDGARLDSLPARVPLCSSSLDHGRAQLERERVYTELVDTELVPGASPSRASLERFHASHEPARGPWSPCMHRADAATVSACQVRVDARAIAMRYADGPPCTTVFGPWRELERAA